MTITARLRDFSEERFEEIARLLYRSPARRTKDDYHDLRVAIKKLRAFFALVNFGAHHFHRKRMIRPLLQIFRQAGKVRELQLELELFHSLGWAKAIPLHVRGTTKALERELRKFDRLNGPWLRQQIESIRENLYNYTEKVSDQELEDFLLQGMAGIRRSLADRWLSEDTLHELRKEIKAHLYIAAIEKKEEVYIQKATDLQEILGRWHDLVVLKNKLARLLETEPVLSGNARSIELLDQLDREAKKILGLFDLEREVLIRLLPRLAPASA